MSLPQKARGKGGGGCSELGVSVAWVLAPEEGGTVPATLWPHLGCHLGPQRQAGGRQRPAERAAPRRPPHPAHPICLP